MGKTAAAREERVRSTETDAPGVWARARMEDQGSSNTGSPVGAVARSNRDPARGRLGRQGGGWARTTEDAGYCSSREWALS